MKVEFIVNADINDGRQIFIQESEFRKAKNNEEEYNTFIKKCKEIQLYDTGVSAQYGEQLVTLITCEYSQINGRMIVVAKKES